MKPTLGFELEAYLVQEGKPCFLSGKEVKIINSLNGWGKDYHFITPYGIEGKTSIPHTSPRIAAANALRNLDEATSRIKFVRKDVVLDAHPTGEHLFGITEHELLGTHVHVGYDAIAQSLLNTQPEAVVWELRKSLSDFLEAYCWSDRLRQRLRLSDADFDDLDVSGRDKRTINYRKTFNTIEFSFPDATMNIDELVTLGKDIQTRVAATIETLKKYPAHIPGVNERRETMQYLLAKYL